MPNLQEIELYNRRVLVRVDFNVPFDQNGDIADDARIKASLPTLQYLVKKGAKVIVASHLGRPKGKNVPKYRMDKVAQHLASLMGEKVSKTDDCIGPEVKQAIDAMKPGEIVMLENVRFHAEEEKNDLWFSRQLAELADLYVNDAFGTAHRAHASTAGVARLLPSFPGFLLEREVTMLNQIIDSARNPRMTIVGGAKVSDKLTLLTNLLNKMDVFIVGGGIANTFLRAKGFDIGNSLFEESLVDTARDFIQKAADHKVELLMPVDVMVADEFSDKAHFQVVPVDQVPKNWRILDIGPQTINIYRQAIGQARTIFWNGPMGAYEFAPFTTGTNEVARAIAAAPAISVVGGGDSLACIDHLGLQDQITHISTGGGATLEFLQGRKLPGLVSCHCDAKLASCIN